MSKKILSLTLFITLLFPLFAQMRDEDFFKMEYKQKSARKAMLLSTLFPGAGQIYANPKAITGYIFPVIEIGLWVGYFHFNSEGKKIESNYEKYANKEIIGFYDRDITILFNDGSQINISEGDPIYRYERGRQKFVQEDLIFHANNPFYTNHFRLDETDTQHFYEDIGKYNKYIFGWADWFDIYATNSNGNWDAPSPDTSNPVSFWKWDNNKWIGNDPQNTTSEYYENPILYIQNNGIYSDMRAEYIDMRLDAEDQYKKGNLLLVGTAVNRIVSAIDALRVTNRQNLAYLAKHDVQIKITPILVDNRISAGLVVQKRF
jgi:hypothetical protein